MPNPVLDLQSFHLIFDALQDGIVVYDQDDLLVWVNDKFCQVSGLPRAAWIGRHATEVAQSTLVQSGLIERLPITAWAAQ